VAHQMYSQDIFSELIILVMVLFFLWHSLIIISSPPVFHLLPVQPALS
jgi:hypothetical protein